MAIREILPPAESSEKFKDWLHQGKSDDTGLWGDDPYGRSEAIRVFHIGLSEIISERGLDKANQVSWRYIHLDSKGPCAIEVQIGAAEKEHRFQEVDRGQMVEEYKALLTAWEDIKELNKEEEYEVAYLRIFALKIGALWLRAAERKNDFFIPIPPHFHGLISGKIYSADQFMDITREAVRTFVSGGDGYYEDDLMGG